MEDGAQLYLENLSTNDRLLCDTIYIPPLNCYFLSLNEKLYRKDIDDKPPYLYLDVLCGWNEGCYFRYSKLPSRIIINKDTMNISVLNPRTKKIELKINKAVGGKISDFRFLGANDNRVVALTWDCHLLLYRLAEGKRRGIIDHYSLEIIKERLERAVCIAVNKDYILLGTKAYNNGIVCSRLLLFKLSEDTLIKKSYIDYYNEKIGYAVALECCGYAGSHILWVSLSDKQNGRAQLYDFDTEKGELVEVKNKRVFHQEEYPCKLIPLNGKFDYGGFFGTLMTLTVNTKRLNLYFL